MSDYGDFTPIDEDEAQPPLDVSSTSYTVVPDTSSNSSINDASGSMQHAALIFHDTFPYRRTTPLPSRVPESAHGAASTSPAIPPVPVATTRSVARPAVPYPASMSILPSVISSPFVVMKIMRLGPLKSLWYSSQWVPNPFSCYLGLSS